MSGWMLGGYLLSPSLHSDSSKKNCQKTQPAWPQACKFEKMQLVSNKILYLLCELQGYYVQGSLWIFVLKGTACCPRCHVSLPKCLPSRVSFQRCLNCMSGRGLLGHCQCRTPRANSTVNRENRTINHDWYEETFHSFFSLHCRI